MRRRWQQARTALQELLLPDYVRQPHVTLALGGIQPVTGEQVLDPLVCRQVQAVMASAGMYDGAGKWMASVGIPAKSGVARRRM